MAAGYCLDLGNILIGGGEYVIDQTELFCQFNTGALAFNADELVCTHRLGQHEGGQSHRTESDNQYCIVAAHPDFLDGLIDGSKAAGHLCAVGIAQLVGKQDQVLLIAEQVLSHAAVTLPAVGSPLVAGAADHEALAALVADTAAADVVDDDAIAFFESLQAFAFLNNLAAGFMAGYYILIAFRAFAQVLAVDASDIAAADCGALGLYQHLAVSRLGYFILCECHGAVAGQHCPFHHAFGHLTPPVR